MDIGSHYTKLKPYLFSIAFNMIGEVHEAEDVVQDSFQDVLEKKTTSVQNPKSYLTRIVINKSIDRFKELKKEREQYPGVWLPEPFLTESESPEHRDILPYAFLSLIERLNPVERAVFILREAFSFSYEEIASLCQISVANSRQILRRSKTKIKDAGVSEVGTPFNSDSPMLNEFLRASTTGDTTSLYRLLKEDIVLYSDGGGKVLAARRVLRGIDHVSKFLIGIARKSPQIWSSARVVLVNNQGAILIENEDHIYAVLILHAVGGRLSQLFIMRNPDKLFYKDLVTKQ